MKRDFLYKFYKNNIINKILHKINKSEESYINTDVQINHIDGRIIQTVKWFDNKTKLHGISQYELQSDYSRLLYDVVFDFNNLVLRKKGHEV